MKHQNRLDWLATLTTRELVIYLMELRQLADEQPELLAEIDDAAAVLRTELLRRELPVRAAS